MSKQYRKTMADRWMECGALIRPPHWSLEQWSERRALLDTAFATATVVSGCAAASLSPPSTGTFPRALPISAYTLVEVPAAEGDVDAGVLITASRAADSRITLAGNVFLDDPDTKEIIGPVFTFHYDTDDSGDVPPQISSGFAPGFDELIPGLTSCVGIALFTLSLCHCRNVTAIEHCPPKRLSKRHAERHGRPLVRYYTLDIEPMRKVLKTEGRMDEVGLAKALHLCRGHFKDYREGGGLFGKHKGLYWWESNVRGSVKAGVVAKDYAIKPPTPEES